MRIGIITDAIDDGAAGIGTYVRNLVENILKIDDKDEYYLIHHSRVQDEFYPRLRKFKNVHEILIPIKNLPFGRELRKIVFMPKILEKYNLDIVHETAQIGPFFTKTNYKKVVSIMDVIPLRLPGVQPLFSRVHHRFGLPIILKKVDRIITISKHTKKDLLDFFDIPGRKIITIPLAASPIFKKIKNKEILNRFKKRFMISSPYILFVGTLEPRKNIPNLIRSFHSMKISGLPHKLIIVGRKGWDYDEIFKLTKELSLGDEILFYDKISDEDLVYFYNAADVFVYPSLYEGFGIPALEAMRCGCPVVASNRSSLPEVVGDAAVMVDPYDVNSIAGAILRVINDGGLRRRLITKGFRQSKKFSWENTSKETIKVYKELGEG